jgi:hypothetical protein
VSQSTSNPRLAAKLPRSYIVVVSLFLCFVPVVWRTSGLFWRISEGSAVAFNAWDFEAAFWDGSTQLFVPGWSFRFQ